MGTVQSLFCATLLCCERVVSWICCAVMLVMIMTMLIVFMIYGISLGYHYGQGEIAKYAAEEGEEKEKEGKRTGSMDNDEIVDKPVVRLVAVNRSQGEQPTDIVSGEYETRTYAEYLDTSPTPLIVLESERPVKEVELTPHEKELALKLIGRFRRVKRNNYTSFSTLLPDNNNTVIASAA